MREWKVSARGAALLLSAAAAAAGCAAAGDEPSEDPREGTPIPAVEVVQARQGTLPLFERLTGTIRASGEVAILPQATGLIVEVLAQNGDGVRKGDPLVRIQTVGSQAQLSQARSTLTVAQAQAREAQANLEQLEAQYERTAALGEQGLVPVDTVVTQRNQVEAARAAAARTRAQVEVAQAALAERSDVQEQTIVRAPISGRVGQRNAEVGMRVDEQSPLFIIGQLDRVRVEVPVTQEVLTEIREGQRVEILASGRREPIEATVSRISPFLDAGSYSAEVEIDVSNEDGQLLPGMFVAVDVFYGETEQATLVPLSALYDDPNTGERGLFVTSEAPAAVPVGQAGQQAGVQPNPMPIPFRPVEMVAEGPQTAGVRGIEAGAWVVVVGQHLLSGQAGNTAPQGRVRVVEWERILELQLLQRQDLLRAFMDKQQRLAGQASRRSGT